jgi:3-oxoacyl-[acyl-carrier protein] reductase
MLALRSDLKALVTGASGTIGKAIAFSLHSMGAHVILSGTNEDKLEKFGSEVLKENYSVRACDLSNTEARSKLLEGIDDLGILVCNAGITDDGLALRLSEESFRKVIDLNLNSTFALNKQAIKIMFRARYGRIINISSVVALTGNVGQSSYCASKAGIIGMTRALAQEVASIGITVNCVAPGFIISNMTDKISEKYRSAILQKIPMGRFGEAEDVAQAVAYLASSQARYVTGQTLHINGGMLMP